MQLSNTKPEQHKKRKTSETRRFSFGGNNRARTCDPLLVRQVLYQLSYASKKMERVTRLELATSTLARWRSTR